MMNLLNMPALSLSTSTGQTQGLVTGLKQRHNAERDAHSLV